MISEGTEVKKTNFMAPFHGWGSTASRLQPLQKGSLLFTAKFPVINLGSMKVCHLTLKHLKRPPTPSGWDAIFMI